MFVGGVVGVFSIAILLLMAFVGVVVDVCWCCC